MQQSEKILRRLPIVIFGFLIFNLGVLAFRSYSDINRLLIINVQTDNLPIKTYQRIELGNNTFITGKTGQLYWKPTSFKDAFILNNIAAKNSSFNLFDILYLFIFTGVLFWMVYDIRQENFFNRKVLIGIQIIGLMVVLYGALGLIQSVVSNYFLNNITKGQFQTPNSDHFSLTPYLIVMLFFQAIPTFIRKAQKIQKEQEYTI
ncbi:MAG TPA: hypothetical protein VGD31_02725 [Sphingobacteriaceae bacterium]